MKKLYYTLLALFLGFSDRAANAAGTSAGGPLQLPNPLEAESFQELLNSILNILLMFATPIFGLMVAIAAYYFLFAGSNPQNRQKAANILKYSVIGYLILVFAKAIVAVLQGLV